jgi:hypothetical protein
VEQKSQGKRECSAGFVGPATTVTPHLWLDTFDLGLSHYESTSLSFLKIKNQMAENRLHTEWRCILLAIFIK